VFLIQKVNDTTVESQGILFPVNRNYEKQQAVKPYFKGDLLLFIYVTINQKIKYKKRTAGIKQLSYFFLE